MYDDDGGGSCNSGWREKQQRRANERASKHCLLCLSFLAGENKREDTHTHIRAKRKTSEAKRREKHDEKAKRFFFRLLINRNHKKAQHVTRAYSFRWSSLSILISNLN